MRRLIETSRSAFELNTHSEMPGRIDRCTSWCTVGSGGSVPPASSPPRDVVRSPLTGCRAAGSTATRPPVEMLTAPLRRSRPVSRTSAYVPGSRPSSTRWPAVLASSTTSAPRASRTYSRPATSSATTSTAEAARTSVSTRSPDPVRLMS